MSHSAGGVFKSQVAAEQRFPSSQVTYRLFEGYLEKVTWPSEPLHRYSHKSAEILGFIPTQLCMYHLNVNTNIALQNWRGHGADLSTKTLSQGWESLKFPLCQVLFDVSGYTIN